MSSHNGTPAPWPETGPSLSPPGPAGQPGPVLDDTAVPAAPAQAGQVPASQGLTGPAPAGVDGVPGPAVPPGPGQADVDQLAGLVYEKVSERIGHRLDVAGEMPSVAEAVALRERAPELYDLWLRIAQERAATGNYVQRAPYQVPERLAQAGRPRALSALVVVLAFCGYLAWLGGPGPYIAGLIAIVDLIAMLSLFFGLRPDHLDGSRHPGRKT